MSGFAAAVRFRSSKTMPRKCPVIKGWNCKTEKPDRITAGLEGWNLEPYFIVNVGIPWKVKMHVRLLIRLAKVQNLHCFRAP